MVGYVATTTRVDGTLYGPWGKVMGPSRPRTGAGRGGRLNRLQDTAGGLLNGDGFADLVGHVANARAGGITIRRWGKRDGTFQAGAAGAGGHRELWVDYTPQLADVTDGDGVPDLVAYVANASGWNTYTALGKGDGTFQAAQSGLAAAGAWVNYRLLLADLNGDGFADLAGYVASLEWVEHLHSKGAEARGHSRRLN